MDLASDSSCVGTELQNGGGWSGHMGLSSPRFKKKQQKKPKQKLTICPPRMCESLIYPKRSESFSQYSALLPSVV